VLIVGSRIKLMYDVEDILEYSINKIEKKKKRLT